MSDTKLSQPEQEKIKTAAKDGAVKLKEKKAELEQEPASDDQRSGLRVIASKLALVAEITTRGATFDITEADIRRWTKEFEDNGKWLENMIDAVIDAIETIFETIIGIFESIGEKIVSIVQRITGEAAVETAADGSCQITGTALVKFEAGGTLTGFDQGQTLGETEGEFSLMLSPIGETSPDLHSFYTVTTFKSGASLVALAQLADVEDVAEGLDHTERSMVEVGVDGTVVGEIYTSFTSPTLKTQEFGPVLGKLAFRGQLNPTRTSLSFSGKSYEFFSMDRLG